MVITDTCAIFHKSVSLELAKVKAVINSGSRSGILLSEFLHEIKTFKHCLVL